MKNIILSTDTACDLTKDILNKNNISLIKFEYFVDETSYKTESDDSTSFEFYNKMKNGADVKTSQINFLWGKRIFRKLV